MTTATHEEALAAALRRAGTPQLELVGPQGAAKLLGLSRPRFYALWKGTTSREADPQFPPPDGRTESGPVWRASVMRAYATTRIRPLPCRCCGKQRMMDTPNGLCATCLPGNEDPDFDPRSRPFPACSACGCLLQGGPGLCENCAKDDEDAKDDEEVQRCLTTSPAI